MDVSHNFREGHTAPFDVLTFWHEERFFSTGQWQWRIQGRDRGADSPLFLEQNWGPKGQKIFFWRPPPPPLISGCGWFPPYLKVFIRHQEPITRRHWVGWLNSDLKYWLQVLPFSPPVDFQPFTLILLLARFSARPHWPHMPRRKTLLKKLAYRSAVI